LQWLLVIFIGVTVTFLIPRLSPVNPVDQALGRLTTFQSLSPEATLALRESLQDLYGLDGTLFEQYINFWKRVLQGDLGPSFTSFPMTVNAIIRNSIGWTIGLLGTSVILAWLLGLILGSLAGYFPNRWWSKVVENGLVTIYPVPYYILAFVLLMLLTYYEEHLLLTGLTSAQYSNMVFCPRSPLSSAHCRSVLLCQRHLLTPNAPVITSSMPKWRHCPNARCSSPI
jgi:peptide/nickel transport system permease protein